jgi:hypothetical protein
MFGAAKPVKPYANKLRGVSDGNCYGNANGHINLCYRCYPYQYAQENSSHKENVNE